MHVDIFWLKTWFCEFYTNNYSFYAGKLLRSYCTWCVLEICNVKAKREHAEISYGSTENFARVH